MPASASSLERVAVQSLIEGGECRNGGESRKKGNGGGEEGCKQGVVGAREISIGESGIETGRCLLCFKYASGLSREASEQV
jgi:hypothetical protein